MSQLWRTGSKVRSLSLLGLASLRPVSNGGGDFSCPYSPDCVEGKVARCLHWLGDPEANELFGRAAARYEEGVREAEEQGRDVPPRTLLDLGELHYLAGHRERALEWYQRAL